MICLLLSLCRRAQGKEFNELAEQTFVVAGNGSAGIGICTGIVQALVAQGMSVEDARSLFHVVGIDGVLCHSKCVERFECDSIFVAAGSWCKELIPVGPMQTIDQVSRFA